MQVLGVFKNLHRTRMAVFKDDDKALKGEELDSQQKNGFFCVYNE